jgi:hypothetical protein
MERQRLRAQDQIERVRVGWPFPFAAGALDIRHDHVQTLADATDNLLLTNAQILKMLVEAV